jgi:very-short-patch-repair endonuclease
MTDEMKPFRFALADAINLLASKYSMSAKTESPIETIFGAEIYRLMKDVLGESFKVGKTGLEADFTLIPQFKLNSFRYDFALCIRGEAYVLIECDGEDFHASPEQIDNDAAKDLTARTNGMQIKRFPGWRINAHAKECAIEAINSLITEGRRRGDF